MNSAITIHYQPAPYTRGAVSPILAWGPSLALVLLEHRLPDASRAGPSLLSEPPIPPPWAQHLRPGPWPPSRLSSAAEPVRGTPRPLRTTATRCLARSSSPTWPPRALERMGVGWLHVFQDSVTGT